MSNAADTSKVRLSDDSSSTFLIRWRGKQEGPYSSVVIETKLAANEIGLLHEIFRNGQWITLRDHFVEREAVLRAERQAKEDQEQRIREEAERKAKEREQRRRAEVLADEARRTEHTESDSFRHQQIPALAPQPAHKRANSPGLRPFGIVLFLAGLATAGYFFLVFDASVDSGKGRVNNLGLMADRQNGVIVGIGLSVIGTIMLVIRTREQN